MHYHTGQHLHFHVHQPTATHRRTTHTSCAAHLRDLPSVKPPTTSRQSITRGRPVPRNVPMGDRRRTRTRAHMPGPRSNLDGTTGDTTTPNPLRQQPIQRHQRTSTTTTTSPSSTLLPRRRGQTHDKQTTGKPRPPCYRLAHYGAHSRPPSQHLLLTQSLHHRYHAGHVDGPYANPESSRTIQTYDWDPPSTQQRLPL